MKKSILFILLLMSYSLPLGAWRFVSVIDYFIKNTAMVNSGIGTCIAGVTAYEYWQKAFSELVKLRAFKQEQKNAQIVGQDQPVDPQVYNKQVSLLKNKSIFNIRKSTLWGALGLGLGSSLFNSQSLPVATGTGAFMAFADFYNTFARLRDTSRKIRAARSNLLFTGSGNTKSFQERNENHAELRRSLPSLYARMIFSGGLCSMLTRSLIKQPFVPGRLLYGALGVTYGISLLKRFEHEFPLAKTPNTHK